MLDINSDIEHRWEKSSNYGILETPLKDTIQRSQSFSKDIHFYIKCINPPRDKLNMYFCIVHKNCHWWGNILLDMLSSSSRCNCSSRGHIRDIECWMCRTDRDTNTPDKFVVRVRGTCLKDNSIRMDPFHHCWSMGGCKLYSCWQIMNMFCKLLCCKIHKLVRGSIKWKFLKDRLLCMFLFRWLDRMMVNNFNILLNLRKFCMVECIVRKFLLSVINSIPMDIALSTDFQQDKFQCHKINN